MVGEAGRAGLLEEDVLAGAESLDRNARVVDRACCDDHGVDVVSVEQLTVGTGPNTQLKRDRRSAVGSSRSDGDKLGARKPSGVARMDRPHPAQPGNPDPDHLVLSG